MMLMNWSDLEPGDVIRFTEETEKYWKPRSLSWTKEWCNRDLTISCIIVDIEWIEINSGYGRFFINKDGTASNGFEPYTGVLFKIISLKEDK